MSYTFLLDAGAESSAECFSAIPACVLSKSSNTQGGYCFNASETEYCLASQSGTTFGLLTQSLGVVELISCAADFHAKTLAQTDKAQALTEPEAGFGERCGVSYLKFDPASCSWKTHQCLWEEVLPESSVILPRWGIMRDGECSLVLLAERNTFETVSTYLPTPTKHNSKEGNYPGEHRRKTPLLATHAGGKINPEWTEWLMGWPRKWTDLQPLEMDKFQAWLLEHGKL